MCLAFNLFVLDGDALCRFYPLVLQTRNSLGIGICKATGGLIERKVNRLRQTDCDCDRQTDCDYLKHTDCDRQIDCVCL